MVVFVAPLNDPRPIISDSKLSRSINQNNVKFNILRIERLGMCMKLLDSFSIEPIVRLRNEGRDMRLKLFPNLEKLYSPISIDNNLGQLCTWNIVFKISFVPSQNELLPILNEINSGKPLT